MVSCKQLLRQPIVLALSLLAACAHMHGQAAWPAPPEPLRPDELDAAALRSKLASPVTIDSFEANTPLKEALDFLQERYAFKISFDHKSFQDSGIKDVEKTPIKMPKMVNVSLSLILDGLIGQVGGQRDTVRYRVRGDAIEITTMRGQAIAAGTRLGGLPNEDVLARRVADLRAKLAMPITIDGFDENTPLRDALGFLGERYGITILLDRMAFKAIGIAEVEATPVKLPKLSNAALGHVLQLLLAQVKGTREQSARFCITDFAAIVVPAKDARPRLCFSSRGELIATVSQAGDRGRLLRTWDRASGKALHSLTIAEADLSAFAFAADRTMLARLTRPAWGPQCRWALWSAAFVEQPGARQWDAVGPVALAPDGFRVAWATPAAWRIRNMQTGEELQRSHAAPGVATSRPFARTEVPSSVWTVGSKTQRLRSGGQDRRRCPRELSWVNRRVRITCP